MGKYEKVMIVIFMTLLAFVVIDVCKEIGNSGKKTKNKSITEIQTETDALRGASLDTATSTNASTSTDAINEKSSKDTTTEITTEEIEEELPTYMALDLEIINQYPELPTGCESVALTMVLKYHGYDIEKTTIASDYLVYSDNFVLGFSGDPFSYGGAGIMAPGLVKTANIFLKDKKSILNAKDITGSTPEELYEYVADGMPVIVWNTIHMFYNCPSGDVRTYKGREYQWDTCEHCVVLSGYDLERNIVIIHDPTDGIVERDADIFWERYESLGSMAVILR